MAFAVSSRPQTAIDVCKTLAISDTWSSRRFTRDPRAKSVRMHRAHDFTESESPITFDAALTLRFRVAALGGAHAVEHLLPACLSLPVFVLALK